MLTERKRVLIIEDEPQIAKLIRLKVESAGYEVEEAYCAEDGLNEIKEDPPDLLILDVVLPDKNGYQVCTELKRNYKINIPVIMLTARVREVDERMGYLCQADSYIRKPLFNEKILPEIERLLRSRGAADQDEKRE